MNRMGEPSFSNDRVDRGEGSASLEMLAYLRGVADTIAALSQTQGPLSLRPMVTPIPVAPLSLQPTWIPTGSLPPHALRFVTELPRRKATLEWPAPFRSEPVGRPVTSRFGELQFHTASAWPLVTLAPPGEPSRGGSRMIELESIVPTRRLDLHGIRQPTIPYGAMLAPAPGSSPSSPEEPDWSDSRISEVRLRAAPLAEEWYELAGVALRVA